MYSDKESKPGNVQLAFKIKPRPIECNDLTPELKKTKYWKEYFEKTK